ncbi:uncharacterized protein N7498_007697 [Penicillium cinerascens]|uniref:BHLH domain-containing protein n=1 Tax=Penicillium cinerascens TaxID=70096 RepID=A0A9W9MDL5_9EURO|nr:uncharacterized protein N7498_007697 [Penicillium cinerascens]KAJ5198580.1 hypothetical protein N7498_007697 [Penicillium cinerascens]
MAFNRPNTLSTLTLEDERYLNQDLSPQSRPMDMFKGSELLPGNWTYGCAIDLFSLNATDMDPVSFDFASSLTTADTKDLFMNPFGTTTAIDGFTMPIAEDAVSLSSDLDSDDQSWSIGMRQSIDMAIHEEPINKPSKPNTRSSSQRTSSSSAWSSSPEIKPQEYLTPTPKTTGRKTRSLSHDSNRSSSQDPQIRNAAKRAAHNVIEKRYRTNMNAKFLALEKAVSPAGAAKQSRGAGSLKKSEILSNALSYIESIQQESAALNKELALLKQNLLPSAMWRQNQHRASA